MTWGFIQVSQGTGMTRSKKTNRIVEVVSGVTRTADYMEIMLGSS
jgi:hypothetical protein